jgi:NAD(P)-dependent dehydrogenase (short-subunit alcohol dehydrogenase family)
MNAAAPAASRVALITGANKGLGRETARRLGQLGYVVYLGARDEARGRAATDELAAAGYETRFVHLDVTDMQSVRAATTEIAARHGRLDALVNNAAVLFEADFQLRMQGRSDFFTLPSAVSPDILQRTFQTNFFGAVAVVNAFLPLLRLSSAGRIVNVSSRLASLADTKLDSTRHLALLAYNTSKAALNSATVQYAYELRGTAVKINSAAPPHSATDLNGHAGGRAPAESVEVIVRLATLGADGPTGSFFDEDGVVPW